MDQTENLKVEGHKKFVIETDVALIYWEDETNGILLGKIKTDSIITIKDAIEIVNIYKNNFHCPNRKLLSDVSRLKSLSKEAKDYFSGDNGLFNYFDALAVISNSKMEIGSMLVHTILKIIPMKKPTRMFYNKAEAIDWLLSFK